MSKQLLITMLLKNKNEKPSKKMMKNELGMKVEIEMSIIY
jgi:hypothetical protein